MRFSLFEGRRVKLCMNKYMNILLQGYKAALTRQRIVIDNALDCDSESYMVVLGQRWVCANTCTLYVHPSNM